jgi:hypothetical protein
MNIGHQSKSKVSEPGDLEKIGRSAKKIAIKNKQVSKYGLSFHQAQPSPLKRYSISSLYKSEIESDSSDET